MDLGVAINLSRHFMQNRWVPLLESLSIRLKRHSRLPASAFCSLLDQVGR